MNRKFVAATLVLFALVSVLAFIAVPKTKERFTSEPTIFVSPSQTRVTVNQTFQVDVNIIGASDLFGWEFKLAWNTSLFELVNVTEADFLRGGGSTYFVPKVMAPDGYILVGCTLLGNVGGLNGNGTLATVEFRAINEGENSTLNLYDTKLVNSLIQLMPENSTNGNVTVWPCADTNGDGVVDVLDLRVVAAYYDVKQGDLLWTGASAYDFNGDGIIDIYDLVYIAANFGITYTS
jgi:hypothetical protein